MNSFRDIVENSEKQRTAYGLAKLLRRLGIAKLVMVTNQVNYQAVYWGQSTPLTRKKPIMPLATAGIVDAYAVFVPLDDNSYMSISDDDGQPTITTMTTII